MPTVKNLDLPDGDVTIRVDSTEPFSIKVKDGKANATEEQVPLLLRAHPNAQAPEATTTAPKES